MNSYIQTLKHNSILIGVSILKTIIYLLYGVSYGLYMFYYPTKTYIFSKIITNNRIYKNVIKNRYDKRRSLPDIYHYTFSWNFEHNTDYNIEIKVVADSITKQHPEKLDYMYRFRVNYTLLNGYTITAVDDPVITYLDASISQLTDNLHHRFIAHDGSRYYSIDRHSTVNPPAIYHGNPSEREAEESLTDFFESTRPYTDTTLHSFISSLDWFMDTAKYRYKDHYSDKYKNNKLQYIAYPKSLLHSRNTNIYYVYETYTILVNAKTNTNYILPVTPDEFPDPIKTEHTTEYPFGTLHHTKHTNSIIPESTEN